MELKLYDCKIHGRDFDLIPARCGDIWIGNVLLCMVRDTWIEMERKYSELPEFGMCALVNMQRRLKFDDKSII